MSFLPCCSPWLRLIAKLNDELHHSRRHDCGAAFVSQFGKRSLESPLRKIAVKVFKNLPMKDRRYAARATHRHDGDVVSDGDVKFLFQTVGGNDGGRGGLFVAEQVDRDSSLAKH